MARPEKCRCICSVPKTLEFFPSGKENGIIKLGFDEYETLRLLDYEKKTQEQCAKRMNISRTTVTRIYEQAREKIASALVNGNKIVIGGGDVKFCPALKEECKNEIHCCHKIDKIGEKV